MACVTNIHGLFGPAPYTGVFIEAVLETVRFVWVGLGHLVGMDRDQLSELGLENMLTTSELAEYLGVKVQAIHAPTVGVLPASQSVENSGIPSPTSAGGWMTFMSRFRTPPLLWVGSDGRASASADRDLRHDHDT